MSHWTQDKYPDYRKVIERHQFIRELYTGDALDEARDRAEEIAENDLSRLRKDDGFEGSDLAREPELGEYLFKRAQGENAQAFYERARLSRQPMHFAQIVDRQVGAVQLAGYATNKWTDENGNGPLGDPAENGSMADVITSDVTGTGVAWDSFLTECITRMLLNSDPNRDRSGLYVLVDGPTGDSERPTAHIISLPAVMDTYSEDGRLKEIVVQEEVQTRSGVADPHDTEQRFIRYTPEGFERYDGDGNLDGEGSGQWENPFWATPQQNQRTLPLFRVDLGLPRDVIRQMAEGEQYLFNLLSDIRMAGRLASFPRLVGDVDDNEFDNTVGALAKGQNVLQGDWRYEIMDWGALKQAREMYKAEVKEYYQSSFQQMNDAAREATATEIRQRDANGRQAFLQHLSAKADEIDNQLRYLFAQYEAPGQPEQWRIPAAERSTDYTPANPEQMAEKKAKVFFGKNAVPADEGTLANAAADIIEDLDVEVADRDALNTAVSLRPSTRQSSGALQRLRNRVNESEE